MSYPVWVLQQDGVIGVSVENYGTAKAKPVKREGAGASFPADSAGSARDGNGHDLSPMYGTPGKYWVSGGYGVWIFDAEKGVMNKGFPASASAYDRGNVKGIAYFADNTMVPDRCRGEYQGDGRGAHDALSGRDHHAHVRRKGQGADGDPRWGEIRRSGIL